MNGFENNVFSMVNSMMSSPEFENMAKHFETQMKESMKNYKAQNSNNTKNSENAETSKPTDSSSCTKDSSTSKTTENSTPKTNNANKRPCGTRMSCPFDGSRMFGPGMFVTQERKAPQKINKQSNSVSIPLKRFDPEQVQINMNKNGLATVTASRENTEESNRNGQRKTTIMIEETCQLPGYLVDNDLLGSVESKFHNGFLVLSYAEDPKLVAEREAEVRKNAPIEIPILMED